MVQVTKHFFIDADEGNFVVLEKSTAQKGKNRGEEIIKTQGYYGTFEAALCGIQKQLTRKCISKYDMDLKEALDKIKKINDKILSVSESHKSSQDE